MKDRKPSAFQKGVSVLGKLFVGTRKGPSGDRVRQLRKLQKRIGVRFTDLSLLEQALTHRSYSHVTSQTRNDSNERMEFLGDSVLGLAVSQFLYLQFPDRSEGALSKMKSLLVSRKVLSTIAREVGLGEFLLLSGEESEMGGRERASILADSFEGVIGAIYLDQGYRASNKFIQQFLLASIHGILKDEDHTNFKSLLQEYVQSKRLSHPVYRVRKEEGPEHEKEFAIEVVVKGEIWGTGRGKSKKDAEQNAARAALEKRQGRAARNRSRAESSEAPPPRERGRRRGRPEAGDRPARASTRERREADERPPRVAAKDRGEHGIAASRERLQESRQAEAEERRRSERDRRDKRRAGRSEEPSRGEGRRTERSRRPRSEERHERGEGRERAEERRRDTRDAAPRRAPRQAGPADADAPAQTERRRRRRRRGEDTPAAAETDRVETTAETRESPPPREPRSRRRAVTAGWSTPEERPAVAESPGESRQPVFAEPETRVSVERRGTRLEPAAEETAATEPVVRESVARGRTAAPEEVFPPAPGAPSEPTPGFVRRRRTRRERPASSGNVERPAETSEQSDTKDESARPESTRPAERPESAGTVERAGPDPSASEPVEPVASREPAPRVESRERAPRVESRERAPRVESRERAPRVESREPAPPVESREPAPPVESREPAPRVESREPPPPVESREPATEDPGEGESTGASAESDDRSDSGFSRRKRRQVRGLRRR